MMILRVLLFVLFLGVPQLAFSAEVIHNYHSEIHILHDGGLHIVETIEVTAEGDKIRRGIYRDFPLSRRTFLGGILPSEYSVKSVKKDGMDEPWHIDINAENGYMRLYIGQSNVMLPTGIRYIYEITYSVPKQVFFFDGYDELNWNVIGTDWAFPINHASAEIVLPPNLSVENYSVYTGTVLSRGSNYKAQERLGSLYVETQHALNPKEGMTIAVSWPEGYVEAASDMVGLAFFWKQHPGLRIMILGFLILCGYYYWAWRAYGIDPKSKGLAPFYTPPKGISPAMAASIYTLGGAGAKEYMTSAIISLASKGYFTIEETRKNAYKITRAPKDDGRVKMSEDEKIIYNKVKTSLTISRSSEKFVSTAKKHKKKIQSLCRKVYFVVNLKWWLVGALITFVTLLFLGSHKEVSAVFWGGLLFVSIFGGVSLGVMYHAIKQIITGTIAQKFGALFMVLWAAGFSVGGFMGLGLLGMFLSWLVIFVMILMVAVVVVMCPIMKAPTYKGQQILDHINGLKYYMESVEEKILKKFDPPEMSRELYETYLPYAVALGVESKWADKFTLAVGSSMAVTGVATSTSPIWYSSYRLSSPSSMSGFSASSMVSSLGSTLSAASSSNSSGGSGGGGSSGGGGGGGGGGGW
ncbi:MAG: DUF2207 domain-containing protein [Alphaproteobacteria bacterium]|nr:DUF2207 domain-containing protein [Alphaproteobacteria bacterium]